MPTPDRLIRRYSFCDAVTVMTGLIRTLVVRTNRYWPFSSLNRVPYYLALKAFIRLCRRFPQIQSAYLRHGLLQNDWVPAISDIDLTVLFQPDSPQKEFQFLSSFWREFNNLKRLFPMIGEVDLLDVQQTSVWTRHTIRGFEAKTWKLLYGDNLLRVSYPEKPEKIRTDAVKHALLYYFNFFLRRLAAPQNRLVELAEMYRIASKILRYASFGGDPLSLPNQPTSKTLLFQELLHSLDILLTQFISEQNGQAFDVVLQPASQGPSQQIEGLARFHSSIRAVYLLSPRNVVVLNGTNQRDSIEILKLCTGKDVPLMVHSPLLYCLLRFFDPRLFTHLASSRMLAYGEDVLPEIPAPPNESFHQQILDQTPTVLSFPTSRTFITCRNPDWFAEKAVESLLQRALFLRLLVEHDIGIPVHSQLVQETTKRYPSVFERYRKFVEAARSGFSTDNRIEIYSLFRSVNQEVCSAVYSAPGQENSP